MKDPQPKSSLKGVLALLCYAFAAMAGVAALAAPSYEAEIRAFVLAAGFAILGVVVARENNSPISALTGQANEIPQAANRVVGGVASPNCAASQLTAIVKSKQSENEPLAGEL